MPSPTHSAGSRFEEPGDPVLELSQSYRQAKAADDIVFAVYFVAKEYRTSPVEVWEWDWGVFRTAMEVIVRLAEEEAKALKGGLRRGRY